MKAFCMALVRLTSEQVGQQEPLTNVMEQARELPEYQRGIDELKSDSIISVHLDKKIGVAGFGYKPLKATDLLEELVQPISEGKRPVFDDHFFDYGYAVFEDAFQGETVECEAIAPVQGWYLSGPLQERSSNTPLIKFSDDLEISQLSAEEEKAVHSMELVRRYGPRWTDHLYAIKATYPRPKVLMRNDEEFSLEQQNSAEDEFVRINDRIEEVLQTLRLFKPGRIRQSGVFHRVNGWWVSTIIRTFGKPLADPIANLNPMYVLETEQDLNDLEEFWQTVQRAKAKGQGFLNIALQRFAESTERHSVEDRVIDLMRAAETLSKAGASPTKRGVIAKYVASHVVEPDKTKVQDHMRETYKLRNSIVHDGDASIWLKKTGKRPEDLLLMVNTAEEYLREALKKTVMEVAK